MTQITAADRARHNKAIARQEHAEERRETRIKERQRRSMLRIKKMLLRHMKRAVKQGRRSYRHGGDPRGAASFRQRLWRAMFFCEHGKTPKGDQKNRQRNSLSGTNVWNEVQNEVQTLQSHFPGWSFELSISILDWEGNNRLDGVVTTSTPNSVDK